MTFYLQTGVSENRDGWREVRTFLDNRIHAGCDVSLTINADATEDESAWRVARHKLDVGGFDA